MIAVPPAARRFRLVTGPAGSGKTGCALEAVRAHGIGAAGPAGEADPGDRVASRKGRGGAVRSGGALLVVPTYARALHLQRVALGSWGARGIFDAPFVTFTSAGERFLPDFRVRALPSAEERDLCLREALRSVAPPAFADVAERAGFRARLLRLVKETKQTGLPVAEAAAALARSADRLRPAARERLRAFVAVLVRYQALLERAGLEDHEDALRRLLDALPDVARAGPAGPLPRVLAVDGFDDFTAVEEAILVALCDAVADAGGEAVVTLPWDDARPRLFEAARGVRERLLARGFVEERLGSGGNAFPRAGPADERPGLRAIAARLFGPTSSRQSAPPVDAEGEVALRVAGDPEEEADLVAREVRRIVAEGAANESVGGEALGVRGWRDVLVVVRRLEGSAPRLERAMTRLGVPVRVVGGGGPLAAEAPARALRGPLRVLGGGTAAGRFEASDVVAWLRWVALARVDDALLRATDEVEMRWRGEGWPVSWREALDRAPAAAVPELRRLEAGRERLAAARDMATAHAALADEVGALLPLPSPSGLDADGRPRDAAHDTRVLRAKGARARIVEAARGLERAARRTAAVSSSAPPGDGVVSAGHAAETVAPRAVAALGEALDRTTFAMPDRRLDAVSLVDMEEARSWEAPVVVVAGLADGEVPARPREDPILRDADRAVLREEAPALALPTAGEREARERRLFYGAVTRATRRLVLVRSAFGEDGGPREPSPFLAHLERVVRWPEPDETPRPGRVAPLRAEGFTRRDLALHAAGALRSADPGRRGLAAALLAEVGGDGLARRAGRWRRRGADVLAPVGRLPEATLARFRATVEEAAPTTLSAAVRCLHRHFLERVAKVPADEVPFAGASFDRRDLGAVLHEAVRVAVAEPLVPPAAVAERVLAAAVFGEEALEPAERDLLRAEVERVVALWRDRERSTAGPFAPLELPDGEGGLEWAFGTRAGRVVELGLEDGRFRLSGKVDRIDVAGGLASVVDYKSGKGTVEWAWKAHREEDDLQLPLYALAVERLLGVRVVALEWAALATRWRRGVWGKEDEALAATRREGGALTVLDPGGLRALLDRSAALAEAAVLSVRAGEHTKRAYDAAECGECAWRSVCRPDPRSPSPRPQAPRVAHPEATPLTEARP